MRKKRAPSNENFRMSAQGHRGTEMNDFSTHVERQVTEISVKQTRPFHTVCSREVSVLFHTSTAFSARQHIKHKNVSKFYKEKPAYRVIIF